MKNICIDNLPKIKTGIKANIGKIDWKKSIGYKVTGTYDEINYEFEIMEYKNRYLTVKYKDREFKILTGNFVKNYLGKILGKITNEFKVEIGEILKDENRNLTITNREVRIKHDKNNKKRNDKWYKYTCNKCGYKGWVIERSVLTGKTGCACCCTAPRVAVLGINTIWDTDKWMIPIVGEEVAKTHTYGSGDSIKPICLDCGRVKNKPMAISTIYQNHSIKCICGDGVSIPNKIMFNLLEQLNVDFEIEKSFKWCKYYNNFKQKECIGMYDFYIPSINKIIEMDGGFHNRNNLMNGQTAEESQLIDDCKDKLAEEYGIEVVRVDCDYENIVNRFEFIKQNITNNKRLNKLFNISQIDWGKIFDFTLTNLCKKACELKANNPDCKTCDIAKKLKMSGTTIRRYFKNGSKIWDWFNYDIEEEKNKNNKNNAIRLKEICSKPTKIFKNEILLGMFESAKEIERQSEKLFGIKLSHSKISLVCNGKRNHHKEFTFKFATQEQYKQWLEKQKKQK